MAHHDRSQQPPAAPSPTHFSGSHRTSSAGSETGPGTPGMQDPAAPMADPHFNIFEWYPAYQRCQRFFLAQAQHDGQVQAMAALVNIRLPHQWSQDPPLHLSQGEDRSSGTGRQATPSRSHASQPKGIVQEVSLIPYIRRLVVTGMDSKAVLRTFFGGEWSKGVGPFWECERRNYLFSAKGIGMVRTQAHYDMGPYETVPFMRPLNATEPELVQAEKVWSEWLSMEDWMLGNRAPDRMQTLGDDDE